MNEALRYSEAARQDLRKILKREMPRLVGGEDVYGSEEAAYDFILAAFGENMLPYMPVLDALRLPARFGMQYAEFLEWLYILKQKANGREFAETRTALTRYLSDKVPREYVAVISEKRNPVRGHYDICHLYRQEVPAEYAAATDWSFSASALKSLSLCGVPAEYAKQLNYMNKTPEWVEVFWQAKVESSYAKRLFYAGHGHHRIVEFWAHDVAVEYAEATPSALAVEDIIAGYADGLAVEYLLALHEKD